MANKATIRQAKYDSIHCTGFYLKLNNVTDSDVIEKLSTLKSKQGYIKQLIREDIARTENQTAESEENKMKKYNVCFRDATTSAVTPIDNITVPDDYTPEQYVKDCDSNGVNWGNGEIIFQEIDD